MRHEQVQQQLAAVKESMAEVAQRVAAAQQEHRAACQAAQDRLALLQRVLKQPSLELPRSGSAAQRLLEQVKAHAAQEMQRCIWGLALACCTAYNA